MYLSTFHHIKIDLGLERVKQVAELMDLLTSNCPVIIVGGTNGKGSTVAGLESIYRAAGFKTGVFTSPILFKHNEYVRINGEEASDESFCEAYEAIEAKRGDTNLTPFEYHTLAALWLFKRSNLDVWILEVGLGGRLDAVNILDADVSVVTNISLDHTEWLGDTGEKIGFEKAGIFRANKPAVYGEINPPISIIQQAEKIGARFYCLGKDFSFVQKNGHWEFNAKNNFSDLPVNTLLVQNMAIVVMVIELLKGELPVSLEVIKTGLKQASLPGRIQIKTGDVTEIFDVSHNPGSIVKLSEKLSTLPCTGKTIAVFSMLKDKDIASCIHLIKDSINEWCIAPLKNERAASIEILEAKLTEQGVNEYACFPTISQALSHARKITTIGDRIIVFGSFHTVAEGICNGSTKERSHY